MLQELEEFRLGCYIWNVISVENKISRFTWTNVNRHKYISRTI